ncbi:unnamed protein product [Schistosoma margrebowiei]|uniref:Uncharacterized protein n=1 Tax=Schistosoma margrebowiei TaxID=48269 RepID=A0A183LN89_9TREM|nr:unnamed protein product [Schistosoma margrebowiei]
MLYIIIATAIVVVGFHIYKRKSNKVTFPLDCFLNEQSAAIDYEVNDKIGVIRSALHALKTRGSYENLFVGISSKNSPQNGRSVDLLSFKDSSQHGSKLAETMIENQGALFRRLVLL